MTHLRLLILSAALALCPPVLAADPCKEDCRRLLAEGQALEGQGKFTQALQKIKEAETLAPNAWMPQALAAGVFYKLSTLAKPEKIEEMRKLARALAGRSLALEPTNPIGQEVLRLLDDGPAPLRAPTPDAAKLLAEAEKHFAQGQLKEALAGYEAVMRADPRYSFAWVGAGNCLFLQKDLPGAERLFRRATEIEPGNAQAWRFLGSTLSQQGKGAAAEEAMLSAIAADPSQRPSWSWLAELRARAQRPLKPLALKRLSRVEQGADGNFTIAYDPSADKNTPDAAIHLARALAEVNLRRQDAGKAKAAFDIELASWRTALKIAAEARANGAEGITDPGLLALQAIEQDGQLEPALLLLQFRQAYRPALERWLAANPGGVKAFIDRYGLQP